MPKSSATTTKRRTVAVAAAVCSMPNLSFSRPLPLRAALIVAALALLLTLAWRPLAIPDEGRYGSIAAAMWTSGDWIVPRLDGLPFFHKPPLFYWLAAPLYGLSGSVPWAARGASWLGAMLGVLGLAWLARAARMREQGEAFAFWAVAVLVAQPLWFVGAQYANLDMLVAGCITLAISALALHEFEPQRRGARWLGFAALGLGVLAKGLIGVVLPLGVLVLWLAWERRFRGWLRLLWLPGWALVLLLTVPWFLAVEARHPGFAHYFIIVQHFQRYTSTGFNNMLPWWTYPAVLAAVALLWWPWCAARVIAPAQFAPMGERGAALERLGLVWLLLIVVFFSLPASKLVGYIFPAVPGLVLIAAGAVCRCAQRADRWRVLPAALALASLLLNVAVVGVVAHVDRKGSAPLAAQLRAQWQDGDALVYDHLYVFDLALLLSLTRPAADVPVLLEWDDPAAVSGDSWQRELADAGAFDAARAAKVLRTPARWPALRCAAPRSWVVARSAERERVTQWLKAPPRLRSDNLDAYLVTRPADCPE
jgi:4-amino-4-deoxy-L-arabinose transferase-like glycosyltransferase